MNPVERSLQQEEISQIACEHSQGEHKIIDPLEKRSLVSCQSQYAFVDRAQSDLGFHASQTLLTLGYEAIIAPSMPNTRTIRRTA